MSTFQYEDLLSVEARNFLEFLHRRFDSKRLDLLQNRKRQRQQPLQFATATENIRGGAWQVASAPADLQDRRVEITGPAEPKMIINALNSGAQVFMADFEDSLSPTWNNVVAGQIALYQAVRKNLELRSEEKTYKLQDKLATLVVRPRGLHLNESHYLVDGEEMAGALFDFGLYFFHNAQELLKRGSGPYFYLPKLETHQEAAWWNEVFNSAQDHLKIPRGKIRATVLIETISAAFEMDEILYVLREHAAGLNAGRWDYIFSLIKRFQEDPTKILPDRAQVTMTTGFMNSYCQLLVQTCHKRGAHAMGGMSAFIPNRREPETTEKALAQVRQDKKREATMGFDGTWVAHPDLIPVAREEFDKVLGSSPNQKNKPLALFDVPASALVDTQIPEASITEAGVRNNIRVALQYIEKWLQGTGAVALNNLMEDAATAEISRSQLWQWLRHGSHLKDGTEINRDWMGRVFREEVAKLERQESRELPQATEVLKDLIFAPVYSDFLTLNANRLLKNNHPHS